MTHDSWCQVVGLTIRTLQRWQKDDAEFKAALQASIKEAEESADPFALYTRQWALEQMHALFAKSKTPTEKRAVLKDILANTQHVADMGDAVDYSDMTEEDLAAICLNQNVSVLGMTEAELVKLATKGET